MNLAPRHVLLTTDAVGGVWTYAVDLAAGLSRRGVRVTLAVLGPPPSDDECAAVRALPQVDLALTSTTLDWLAATPDELDVAERAVMALAHRCGADLIHLNSPAVLTAATDIPVVGGCHSCLGTWWDAVRSGPLPQDFAWKVERLGSAYRLCDRLIAPSYAFMQATACRYGVVPTTVWNGRAGSVGPVVKAPVALTSGRLWDPGKNIAALDRAAVRMRGLVDAAGSVLSPDGDGCRFQHLNLVGRLSPDAMAERLARAAVYVSTSLYEPFGLGVLEAAQASCALVLSDIPTFRELWGEAAVFVDPDDDASLAATLDALLDDPETCARRGRMAADRAGKFGLDAMIDGVMSVYADALRARAPFAEAAA